MATRHHRRVRVLIVLSVAIAMIAGAIWIAMTAVNIANGHNRIRLEKDWPMSLRVPGRPVVWLTEKERKVLVQGIDEATRSSTDPLLIMAMRVRYGGGDVGRCPFVSCDVVDANGLWTGVSVKVIQDGGIIIYMSNTSCNVRVGSLALDALAGS